MANSKLEKSLGLIRKKIDLIDDHMLSLLEERVSLVIDAENLKKNTSKGPFYRPDREKEVEHLYAKAKKMNNVNYNETIANKQIRQMLKSQHIMSYRSIYEETSCLCLIEAMSAGCLSVIPNFGAS